MSKSVKLLKENQHHEQASSRTTNLYKDRNIFNEKESNNQGETDV